MRRYKVLVVDDSAFMRKIISDFINEHPQFEVTATARNGREAVDSVIRLKPDIVTMDVEMPVMNGLEALREIMRRSPLPVIMLSSLTGSGTSETLKALEWGAVDFIRKPSGSISLDLYKVKEMLYEKLLAGVEARVRGPCPDPEPAAMPLKPKRPLAREKPASFSHLVAIGTSTGGPRALQTVLTRLPEDFPAPVLVVQHMPPNFTKQLAARLNGLCQVRVDEAEDGETIAAGSVYIAPGGQHMKLVRDGRGDQYRIALSKEEPRNGHRPSVDVLFESLAPLTELKRHLVILTGMGSDGAKGMKLVKESGAASTIAEAEETCVVYGMPRAARELGAADRSEKLHDIADVLLQRVR